MKNVTFVGYCRKTLTKEDDRIRAHLLQQMAMKLKTRSLVDRDYISLRSPASYVVGTYRTEIQTVHLVYQKSKV
ncbi:hypothetical protein BDA99DRAFT_515149 [Phascolomyces articulosus]|uniref:Uncharacterized protein n=1 Tax=Phascolomyces articulosus TaxID=60185 RepID=A0AAD5PC61_9FUNG|nr:hypothetical protein BDA99DRAFT_515149 [Phascolomyces articulosus]